MIGLNIASQRMQAGKGQVSDVDERTILPVRIPLKLPTFLRSKAIIPYVSCVQTLGRKATTRMSLPSATHLHISSPRYFDIP